MNIWDMFGLLGFVAAFGALGEAWKLKQRTEILEQQIKNKKEK